MMTAGYLSAEAYSVLKSKTHLCDLSVDELSLLPNNVAMEIKRLSEDEEIKKSIFGLEQMEEWILNGDQSSFKLLDLLSSSSSETIKQFLSKTGSRYFLLNYVFSDKERLSEQAFVYEDNLAEVTSFIIKCEKAFAHLFATGEIEPNLLSRKPMSYKDFITTETIENPLVGEGAEMYGVKKSTAKPNFYTVDQDAISPQNEKYTKLVLVLSQLTEEEFEPFKRYFDSQLLRTPVRTSNGIKSVGLHEFCVNYLFASDVKLLSIRNFGRKSVHDFGLIKQTVIDHIASIIDNPKSDLEDIVTSGSEYNKAKQELSLKEIIGDTQYSLLGRMLHNHIQSISVRSRNAITNYHGDFIEDFVHMNMSVIALKNIGRKSSEEILKVINILKDYVEKTKSVDEISPEQCQVMEFQLYYGDCLDDFVLQYFNSHGHLPMFHILENWLKNQKGREWNMLNSCCSIFADNKKKTLDELAEESDLSRERCRQLCIKALNRLHTVDNEELESSTINYSNIISDKNEWAYISDAISDKNLLELSLVKSYIDEEKCNLSQEFCFLILSIVFEKELAVVGRELMSLPTRAKQKWTNTYLVKREYTEAFCFNALPSLVDEIEESLTDDIEVDAEQLAIDTFFMVWNDFDTEKVSVVADILSHILIQEFGKIPNEFFQFTFEGRKVINATDIIYEILRSNGDPMNIDDVFDKLDEVCPKKYKSSASIKTLVANDPRLCMVGKTNMVGLLEWKHVKIGSIRDIIVQYLSKFNEPVHVAQIVEYVQNYRDSSEKSIRSTMNSGDQFVQFSGGLFGLKDKTYASRYDIPEKRKTFAHRVNDLEIFLGENMHFPFSRATDSREDSLYNWWRRVLISEDLSEEQQAEVRRIQDQYKDYPTARRDNEWNKLYRKYKSFIHDFGRRPSDKNSHEKILCRWFEKVRSDFYNGDLSTAQVKIYIELCNLL